MLSTSREMTSATASMIAKVSRYWTSSIVSLPRGGTKMKSKAATENTDAAIAGPRGNRSAMITTASKYTIAMFTRSNRERMANPASVQTAVAPAADEYPIQFQFTFIDSL